MKLTNYSRNRLLETFRTWNVAKEFAEPMYNYLVFGWKPGSCFTAVLANDFARAIASSHPANTIPAFKALVGWIGDNVPRQARGGYDEIDNWCYLTAEERRKVLEEHELIYTEAKEVWMTLEDKPTVEPVLY